MTTLADKINATLSRSLCQGWDRNFLVSIQGKLEAGKTISKRQHEVLAQILDKCSDSNEEKHIDWGHVYRIKYQTDAVVLAYYHITHRYYNDISSVILDGDVPSQHKFKRMYNNKYSQKVLAEYNKDPRLPLGEYVLARSSCNSYKNIQTHHINDYSGARDCVKRFMKDGGFIVGVEKYIHSAAKGAKRYRILPPGKPHYIIIEERFLKRGLK
jgi:hypothetical protein